MKKSIISCVFVTLVVSLVSVQAFADLQSLCNYGKLERSFVDDFGLSKDQAHAYRLSVETFAMQEGQLGVSFATVQELYSKDLNIMANELETDYFVTPAQAQYYVSALELVRLNATIYGFSLQDPACLGMAWKNKTH